MHPFTIGIIASRNQPEYEYFTSAQYPILVEEELGVSTQTMSGTVWGVPDDSLTVFTLPISASLIPTIVYQTYNNPLYVDTMSIGVAPLSANLISTIVYQTYNNPLYVDTMSVDVQPLTAALATVISYVTYNNTTPGAIENLAINAPQVISGSLT